MPILLALLATATVATAPAYKAPRNAFGQPDFEGTWTNASLTSLERPANFKTLTIPEQQATAAETMRAKAMAAGNRPIDPKEGAPPKADDPDEYRSHWIDLNLILELTVPAESAARPGPGPAAAEGNPPED